MTSTVKQLIRQGIFYSIWVLIFQSFITFYIIKYFDGIQWAIIGNMILYLAVACGYAIVAWLNHQWPISVRAWMFSAIVLCVLSTCMMQWKTMRLLMIWYAFLWLGKWMYFCCLYLYEFKYVEHDQRTKYAALGSAWRSAAEIAIPLVLGYAFSVVPYYQAVYLAVFIAAAIGLLLTALAIYKLPDFTIQPLEHSHYVSIFKKTSWTALWYLTLVWLNVIIPFIGTLLEVQILEKESWTWIFQSATKAVTLIILLLILRYFHVRHQAKHFMILSALLWLSLLLMPWWSGWLVLIVYVIARSLLLSLFTTYEKPIGMQVMESMSSEWHSMLPVIIVQVVLQSSMRIAILAVALFILTRFGTPALTYGIILLTWLGFMAISGLVYY